MKSISPVKKVKKKNSFKEDEMQIILSVKLPNKEQKLLVVDGGPNFTFIKA